ncbi:hypothetical protein [Thalassobacillus sp. C254]|uniref:hypothetical protein n=1 Tax=Thalassobacillus sp. C254 TaxID=1225341 RepID=UPI0006D01E20|nr:hypothetical protein [Thalassobacillus sp. C254]
MVWMKEKEPPVDNSNLEPRINTVESKVNDFTRNANRQTAPLGPGYNVINTDQSTPVDFEIEGRTLVNLMGREGGFEYGNPFTGGGGVVVDDEAFSGKYSFRNSYTWSGLNLTDDLNIEKDNYVLLVRW